MASIVAPQPNADWSPPTGMTVTVPSQDVTPATVNLATSNLSKRGPSTASRR